ncbi:MAG: MFS transporter, partial [Pseudomonadota bacterium]
CLALSRAVFGLIGSGSSPSAQAYVADRTEPSERQSEIAFVTSGFSFGTVVGPAFAVGVAPAAPIADVPGAAAAAMWWPDYPEFT